MHVSAIKNFVCPMDGLPFVNQINVLKCEKGHAFDLASEGYCNLLLVQDKASLNPGDNKEMVAARKRFLDTGKFSPIADYLFKTLIDVVSKINRDGVLRIVDAGCGEGYYLNQLKEFALASSRSGKLELAGFDISKWAVRAAAKRTKEIAWAVASNRKVPFAAGSIDLILSMFGFPIWESFKTVQPASGRVLVVEPGPKHLIELREIIYSEVVESGGTSLQSAFDLGYVLESEKKLEFTIDLQNVFEIQDLLAMTPHGYRMSEQGRAEIKAKEQLIVSVDVLMRILKLAA